MSTNSDVAFDFLSEYCAADDILSVKNAINKACTYEYAAWHPLGFIRIPLIKRPSIAISFNCWPHSADAAECVVHMHNDNIHSLIICGKMTSNTWRVDEGPWGDHELCEATHSGIHSALNGTGVFAAVALESSLDVNSGSAYRVARQVYHSILVPAFQATISLCVMTDRVPLKQYALIKSARAASRIQALLPAVSPVLQRNLFFAIGEALAERAQQSVPPDVSAAASCRQGRG